MALSTRASSSGVSVPSITLKKLTKFIIFERRTSAGFSFESITGISKGLIECSSKLKCLTKFIIFERRTSAGFSFESITELYLEH